MRELESVLYTTEINTAGSTDIGAGTVRGAFPSQRRLGRCWGLLDVLTTERTNKR
jgi:hypothetical protein